jgi:peptidylprolyl isomerase
MVKPMLKPLLYLAALFLTLAAAPVPAGNPSPAAPAAPAPEDRENLIYLDVGNAHETYGRVVIKLRPDLAPKHVERIKILARRGFYDGLIFHRVIPGFMAQTGDPKGTGEGHSDLPDLEPEFTATPHYRGIVSMARSQASNSANSQFFIMLNDKASLNNQYTVLGEVINGIKFMDRIKKGDPDNDGAVEPPADRIIRMRVAADVKE